MNREIKLGRPPTMTRDYRVEGGADTGEDRIISEPKDFDYQGD